MVMSVQEIHLPRLPGNARYVKHKKTCDDWGTFGWALRMQNLNTSNFKHFIFLTSAARGPFTPPYLTVRPFLLLLQCMTLYPDTYFKPYHLIWCGKSISCGNVNEQKQC
jgi:hypothetical protein